LYPIGSVAPEFILPSVLHGTGWCRRPLTEPELWMVYNIPHQVVVASQALSVGEQVHVRRHLLGGRCLQEGLRIFLQGMGIMGDGGVLSMSGPRAMDNLVTQMTSVRTSKRSQEPVLPLDTRMIDECLEDNGSGYFGFTSSSISETVDSISEIGFTSSSISETVDSISETAVKTDLGMVFKDDDDGEFENVRMQHKNRSA
jgi:hypothetical protein